MTESQTPDETNLLGKLTDIQNAVYHTKHQPAQNLIPTTIINEKHILVGKIPQNTSNKTKEDL